MKHASKLLAFGDIKNHRTPLRFSSTLAINNGWLQTDPFVNFRIRFEKADQGYLMQEEPEILMQKRFSIKRLASEGYFCFFMFYWPGIC